jgi:hypothetical protein
LAVTTKSIVSKSATPTTFSKTGTPKVAGVAADNLAAARIVAGRAVPANVVAGRAIAGKVVAGRAIASKTIA